MVKFQNGQNAGNAERKRRNHVKSRKGCANCKLRRVKCDETRPKCRKCIDYGVDCSYDSKQATLDLSARGSFQVHFTNAVPPLPSPPRNSPSSGGSGAEEEEEEGMAMIPHIPNDAHTQSLTAMQPPTPSSSFGIWHLMPHWNYSPSDMSIFQRFQTRTVETVGSKGGAPIYKQRISPMAFQYPFYMHIILSVTLSHDVFLAKNPESRCTTPDSPKPPTDAVTVGRLTHASIKHWATATTLFNNALSRPIEPASRDALWATAALIGTLVFAFVEADSPEDVWPLKPADLHDLDWIKLTEGKREVWKIADPRRPDSAFRGLVKAHDYIALPDFVDLQAWNGVPVQLRQLFDIDENTEKGGEAGSGKSENPYFLEVMILLGLQDLVPNHWNLLNFLSFLGHMPASLRELIEAKDVRAMVLLVWWLMGLEKSELWWLRKRSVVTGHAIRVWLERRFGGRGALDGVWESMRMGWNWWEIEGVTRVLKGENVPHLGWRVRMTEMPDSDHSPAWDSESSGDASAFEWPGVVGIVR